MYERYLNPFVDYGFKKLFATEENKDLLISFLNAIIGGKDPIVDLRYKNVERIGDLVGTRTNYFDVYCETTLGDEFIVEMQNTWQPFFKDRTIYYAAKPIHDQGKKGIQAALDAQALEEAEEDLEPDSNGDEKKRNKGWDYKLKNVYVVAMMNFRLPKKEYPEDSFFHKIQLMDVEDFHVFYEKLTLYYVELPKIDNMKLDLNTPFGRWFHALNNLYYYDRQPSELKEPVFDKLFRQAELARLTPDQDLAYERSMKVYLDTFNQIEGARILGHSDGLAEGKELGLAEGKELGLAEGKELGLAEGKELGLAEGKKQGLAEGKELGLAEGKELGLAEGKELGLAEGKREVNREMAKKMLALGVDRDTVLAVTGLSEEDLIQQEGD